MATTGANTHGTYRNAADVALAEAMRDMCKLLDLMQARSKFDGRWKGAYARLDAIFDKVDEASTRQTWAKWASVPPSASAAL